MKSYLLLALFFLGACGSQGSSGSIPETKNIQSIINTNTIWKCEDVKFNPDGTIKDSVLKFYNFYLNNKGVLKDNCEETEKLNPITNLNDPVFKCDSINFDWENTENTVKLVFEDTSSTSLINVEINPWNNQPGENRDTMSYNLNSYDSWCNKQSIVSIYFY